MFFSFRLQKYKIILTFALKLKVNMRFPLYFIRNYPFSCLLFAAIWYLSFFTPPPTRLDDVAFIDKRVHIVMYGITCLVIWIEYLRRHTRPNYGKLFVWAWLMPILMSGLIELLQEYCTGGRRAGDWLDLAANAIGVSTAALIGLILLRYHARH